MTATMQACAAICVALEEPCGTETVITVTVGCVHEHLKTIPFCQWHVEALANKQTRCRECRLSGHNCELHLLREVTP